MKDIVIDSEQEYQVVAKRIEELKNAPAGRNPAKELKALVKAVIQYERRNQPVSVVDKRFEIKY